jgi:large subunit ribosomal protein L24
MARIKKGDMVAVLSGKDRGKTGKVLQVWPDRDQALVEHLNVATHFERPSQQNQKGGIIQREAPLALSKLGVFCPRCRKPSRGAWAVGAEKRRICHRCKEPL